MTIDPADFVAQGAPTVDQVRAAWESTPSPSARRVADILTRRGFAITYRTVARYRADDWSAKDPVKQTNSGKTKPEKPTPEDRAALDRELAVIQNHAEAPRNEETPAGDDPTSPPQGEVDPVEAAYLKRSRELMELSENALRKLEAKKRVVTNILLLEAMGRKAHVMILVPKDTGALVSAMTEAADASLSTGKADGLPNAGNNAKDVTPGNNPRAGGSDIIDVTPNAPNQQADTIAAFRRKLNRA